jgi:hypothetical protein
LEIVQIDCLRLVMQDDDRPLTADECDELSRALRQDAARLPSGLKKENLSQLAAGFGALADLKRMVLREAN